MTYIKLSTESTGDAGDQYTGLDRFGRVMDQRWINGSNTDVDRYQYGYDRDGNRLYKDNKVLTALSEVYTYDSLNQLASYKLGTLNGTKTDVTGSPSNSQSWDYDAVGNWDSITTNSTTQTRTANKQNEITAVSGATTPTYDSNGNLTTDENNYRFVHDAWNKVVQVKNSSNVVIVTYGRDALHRHVTDTVGSTVTDRFFSSNWQLLETKVGSNTITRNVWSPVYIDSLVLRDQDTDANGTLDERLYALQDANWNTTALVNTSGTVQERYTYTPFGQVTFRDGSGSTLSSSAKDWIFLHQGGERIAAGDYEFRNRVYSPSLGRWLSNDPLGFEAGDQNWYRTIGNNPENGMDPFGLKELPNERSVKVGPVSIQGFEVTGFVATKSTTKIGEKKKVCCPGTNKEGEIYTLYVNYSLDLNLTIEKTLSLNLLNKQWKKLVMERVPLLGKLIKIKDMIAAELAITGDIGLFKKSSEEFEINTCNNKPEIKEFYHQVSVPIQLSARARLGLNVTIGDILTAVINPTITGNIEIPVIIKGTISPTGEVKTSATELEFDQIQANIKLQMFGKEIDQPFRKLFNLFQKYGDW